MNYNWIYGENESHRYYECIPQKGDYLCIFANTFDGANPNMFMVVVGKRGESDRCIQDKAFNDRMRKKGILATRPLQSENVEYLKQKAIYCYERGKSEVRP